VYWLPPADTPELGPMPQSTRMTRSFAPRTRNPPSASSTMPFSSRNCRCGAHISSVVPTNLLGAAFMTPSKMGSIVSSPIFMGVMRAPPRTPA
jgi:hypothetical protein